MESKLVKKGDMLSDEFNSKETAFQTGFSTLR